MKTYKIELTQPLTGHYNGEIKIEADSPGQALRLLREMSNSEIDDLADWTQGDEYYGDLNNIEIIEDTIEEIDYE